MGYIMGYQIYNGIYHWMYNLVRKEMEERQSSGRETEQMREGEREDYSGAKRKGRETEQWKRDRANERGRERGLYNRIYHGIYNI